MLVFLKKEEYPHPVGRVRCLPLLIRIDKAVADAGGLRCIFIYKFLLIGNADD